MEKILRVIVLFLSLSAIIEGIIIVHLCGVPPASVTEVLHRDTVTDTIRYPLPVPRDSAVLRYINVTVYDTLTKTCDSIAIDSNKVVTLPITQKCYQDSTYRAYVSGFQPSLDSCIVFPRTIQIITKTSKNPSQSPKFGWGPQIGIGITPKGILPYAGIGLFYRF